MERGKPKTQTGPRRPLGEVVVLTEKGGTPTKYTDTVPSQVLIMSQLGLTIPNMAEILQIGLSTLEMWISTRKEVGEAYQLGRWRFNTEVEETLRQRALGYEYEEVKEYAGTDSLGRPWHRTVRTTKRVEPSDTAIIFYLKNRHGDRWRDVWNTIQGTNMSLTQVNNMNLDIFSEDERKMIRSMAIKRLADSNGISD